MLVADVDGDQPLLVVGRRHRILQNAPKRGRAGIHQNRPGDVLLHRLHAGVGGRNLPIGQPEHLPAASDELLPQVEAEAAIGALQALPVVLDCHRDGLRKGDAEGGQRVRQYPQVHVPRP